MHSSHTFHVDPVQRPTFGLYDAPEDPPFTALRLGDLGSLTLILQDTHKHAAWLRDLAETVAELAVIVESRAALQAVSA